MKESQTGEKTDQPTDQPITHISIAWISESMVKQFYLTHW